MTISWRVRVARILGSVLLIAFIAITAFLLHTKSFAASLIFLLPIMFIAFRWGMIEASVASLVAVGCLDYLFTEPLFELYMTDPQDWIALSSFEAVVLLVSRFATQLRRHASDADQRREEIERLYQLSKDILLLERRTLLGSQISRLIRDIFEFDEVSLWDARGGHLDKTGEVSILKDAAFAASLHSQDFKETSQGRFIRQMVVGGRSVGVIGFMCTSDKNQIDVSSADAIASLAALAMERVYSFQAEKDAEASKQTEQFRSALLDGLAHSFKTPLATIQAASSGLLEIGLQSPPQRELAFLINQEAIKLTSLTNDALKTAGTEDKRLQVHKEKLQIDLFLENLVRESSECLLDHPVTISNEIQGKTLWADERLLRMALMELLDNASKYSDPGSAIVLKAYRTETDTVIGVHNDNSYIEPEDRMRIFGRFYRSPKFRHRVPGTGIGLSFVRQIIEAQRGHIWVKSDQAVGTTVFLSVPLTHKEV